MKRIKYSRHNDTHDYLEKIQLFLNYYMKIWWNVDKTQKIVSKKMCVTQQMIKKKYKKILKN